MTVDGFGRIFDIRASAFRAVWLGDFTTIGTGKAIDLASVAIFRPGTVMPFSTGR
tara:strand:- start:606 stop:770 length:165 start_codon:yes stop_codon:yes gene_type:complete